MATNAPTTPNYISLTSGNTDYASQLAAIARRQKYAELLAQQGGEDIDVQSVGGVPTPISPFQGLAKVFQTGMGAYLSGKAGEDEAALDTVQSKKYADALAAMYNERPDMTNKNDLVITGRIDPATHKPGPNVETVDTRGVFNRPTTGPEQMEAARGLVGTKYENMVPGMLSEAQRTSRQGVEDERANTALALEATRYATGQTQKAAEDAESKRRFGITSEISRTNALDKPTMRFVTVTGPDGKPKRVMMSDAQIIAAQTGGQNVSDTTIKAMPHFTAQQFMKLGEGLTADINTAGRLKGYMKDAKDIPQGFKLIAQDFANKFTTAFGGSLKGDALKIAMQNGTLQSLIGNLRIETVGGGVMTEQDAIRVIQALGGDLSLLRNKDVVDGQIRKILESKEARIKQDMQFYNRDAELQGVAPMEYSFQSAGSAAAPAKLLTEADIKNSMIKNGKTRQEVIDFATSKGYKIAP